MSKEIEQLKEFIFSDNFQNKLKEIDNSFIHYNILEITGMGNQEIKHSNILRWLFDYSEHNLGYKILNGFLKQVTLENTNNGIEELKNYIEKEKSNLKIYREEDNIDLLILDEKNKVVITIENKVFAKESIGQLKRYENIIGKRYKDYEKYFIFLTINLENPSKGNENWFKANYQMITNTIEEIINKNDEDLSIKTKIIFESYIDLLKKKKIIKNTKLDEICNQIWRNHKKELDLIYNILEKEEFQNILEDKRLLNSLKLLIKYKPLINIKDLNIENELLKILIEKIDERLKDEIGIVKPNDKQFYIKNNITKTTFVWINYSKRNISISFNQLKTSKLNDDEKNDILNKYNGIGKFTNRELIVKIKNENDISNDLLNLIEDEMNRRIKNSM